MNRLHVDTTFKSAFYASRLLPVGYYLPVSVPIDSNTEDKLFMIRSSQYLHTHINVQQYDIMQTHELGAQTTPKVCVVNGKQNMTTT